MARKKNRGATVKSTVEMQEEYRKRTAMKPEEIQELMDLMGWSQGRLARELEITPGAVSYWMSRDSVPSGPARKQMRQWLDEARARPKRPVKQTA